MDYLYRFRSARALLEKYNELDAEEIFFSSPDALNDPMEGFKDIFWRGDNIIWQNFLRHYLLTLLQTTMQVGFDGAEFRSGECASFVHMTDDDFPDAPIKGVYANICQEFLLVPIVGKLIAALSSQQRPVRRSELLFYLGSFQPIALSKISAATAMNGIGLFNLSADADSIIDEISRNVEEVISIGSSSIDNADELFSGLENVRRQMDLIHRVDNNACIDAGMTFIMRDFPEFYVNSLERLIYPDWHVACFVENPGNASMWGGYADNHKGVCLKFKTKKNTDGKPILDLYRANGWSMSVNDGISSHYSFSPHTFEKVNYESDFPEVDFFESMGMLSVGKLTQFWLSGENGQRSSTAKKMLSEDEDWRSDHWAIFKSSFTTKTRDWMHEKEYRLALYSNLERFDDPSMRKIKYRFDDLAGIVFGIKTSMQDKISIVRIIEKKCLESKRGDFEFYQANYSIKTKSIELIPLSFLKSK